MKKLIPIILMCALAPAAFAKGKSEKNSHDGFLIGFDAGIGDFEDKDFIGTNDRYVGLNLSFYMGGSFTQEIALMGLFDGNFGRVEVAGEDVNVSTGVLVAAVQYSHPSGFIVRGGPGVASTHAEVEVSGVTYKAERDGFAMYVSPAYEFYQSGRFAIDANIKFVPQWYKSSEGGFSYALAGGMGFTWY